MKDKNSQLKIGAILSYAQMGLTIVIGLIYTPIMIRILGQSEYGLYNIVASTISIMSVLSLGFNSSYIRFYSRYKKQGDKESLFRLNGSYMIIYIAIATIVMLCGIYLSQHLEIVFDNGLTDAEYRIAKVLSLLLTINLALSFPMSVFSSIISAHEKFVFLKLIGIGKTVLSPMITLPILLMGFRSIAMVTVSLVVSVIVDLIYLIYVIVILKQKFYLGKIDRKLFVELSSFTLFIALELIVDQVNWNIGKVILGRIRGTQAVAIYSVGYSLYSYYQMFSVSVSGVFTPRIHKIVNETSGETQKQRVTDIFIKVGRIQFLILSLVSTGILFFGKSFILNLWAGDAYGDSYFVAVALILSASIALIQNVGIEVQRAMNKHKFRSVTYIIIAIINLSATIFLSQKYGAIGASIGTAFSLIIGNGFIMNIYYHKQCNINIILFWRSILRLSLGLIPPMVVGICMNQVLDLDNILVFLISIVVYVFVYSISMWIIGMNEYEKDIIRKTLNKVARKK